MQAYILDQMDCCLACGGPYRPEASALRKDRVGTRALYYIEGEIIKHRDEWNNTEEPALLSSVHGSHIFHDTRIIPVIELFVSGALRDVYVGDGTPDGDQAYPLGHANYVADLTGNVNAAHAVVKEVEEPRAVFWTRPDPIPRMTTLHQCIFLCLTRFFTRASDTGLLANYHTMLCICERCNQIMTQLSTTSHLLARQKLSLTPLVPDQAMCVYKLHGNRRDLTSLTYGARFWDPREQTRDSKKFTYEGCLAYYLHRCMPTRPSRIPVGTEHIIHRYRLLSVMLGWLLLEICALMTERREGSQGGAVRNPKPQYRYRGVIEVYVSYCLWILFTNDTVEGGEVAGICCRLPFHVFHRYFFSEFLDALVLTNPELAAAVEISDVIFTRDWARGGGAPIPSDVVMNEPAVVIGRMAFSLASFYTQRAKPIFSRHLGGLQPDPNLLTPPQTNNRTHLFVQQALVCNMLVDVRDLISVMHQCQRAVAYDVDTFINRLGVHAVMRMWNRELQSAPVRADSLLEDFTRAWTLHEYHNIQKHAQSDPDQPKMSAETAESIYLMCNALELTRTALTRDEVDALRSASKCSVYKAVMRLLMSGAFEVDE